MHDSWEPGSVKRFAYVRVVTGLALVDVVVWVNGRFGAQDSAEDFDCSIRNNLARVKSVDTSFAFMLV